MAPEAATADWRRKPLARKGLCQWRLGAPDLLAGSVMVSPLADTSKTKQCQHQIRPATPPEQIEPATQSAKGTAVILRPATSKWRLNT